MCLCPPQFNGSVLSPGFSLGCDCSFFSCSCHGNDEPEDSAAHSPGGSAGHGQGLRVHCRNEAEGGTLLQGAWDFFQPWPPGKVAWEERVLCLMLINVNLMPILPQVCFSDDDKKSESSLALARRLHGERCFLPV